MENHTIPGKPGLFFLAAGGVLQWLSHLDRTAITFVLGTIATALAILYYIIQIYKSLKK